MNTEISIEDMTSIFVMRFDRINGYQNEFRQQMPHKTNIYGYVLVS